MESYGFVRHGAEYPKKIRNDGPLKLSLNIQAISFPIMADYGKVAGSDEDRLAGHLRSYLRKALDVTEIFLFGWHMEHFVGGWFSVSVCRMVWKLLLIEWRNYIILYHIIS